MDDSLVQAAGQSQVHGCSSYPLSFPSLPPDIKHWFSSYEYESPEASELVADPGGHNCSETQDPLEHSLFIHVPRDGGVALGENRLGGQSENGVFDRKDFVAVDESMVKRPPKRKQSLRALFRVSFLDKHEEATESECQVALNEQRNALEPLLTCNATGLLGTKRSLEGATEHEKVPVDSDGISSIDTQVSSPADQEVEYSKPPVTCVGSSLADIQKCVPEDGIDSIEHGKAPVDCSGFSSADTQISSPIHQDIEYSKLPVTYVGSSLADIQKCVPEDDIDSIEHGKAPVDGSGISSADTQINSPVHQDVEYSKLPVTVGSSLADIQKYFPEEGIDSTEMPINIYSTNLADTEKGSRDGVECNRLPASHDSISLADTKENSPLQEIGRCKALDDKEPEATVASNGFVAIKREEKLTEELMMNKIPKYPMGKAKATFRENHSMFELIFREKLTEALVQGHNRSPLADRTNFSEAAAAPTTEFCGKWKCPRKGKPSAGPPMKQLRLEQWLRRVN